MISAGFSTETGPAGPGCFCLFQLRLPEKSWDSTNLIRKSGVSPPKKVVVVDGWIMDRIQAPAHGCPTSSPTAPCIGWQCKAIGSTNLPNLPCYTMLMGGINIYKLSLKYALWHWEYHHYLSLPPKSPKPWGFYHPVPHDVPYIGYILVPSRQPRLSRQKAPRLSRLRRWRASQCTITQFHLDFFARSKDQWEPNQIMH